MDSFRCWPQAVGTKGPDQVGTSGSKRPAQERPCPPQAWITGEGAACTCLHPPWGPESSEAPTTVGSRRKLRPGPRLQADPSDGSAGGSQRGLLLARHCIVGEGLDHGGLGASTRCPNLENTLYRKRANFACSEAQTSHKGLYHLPITSRLSPHFWFWPHQPSCVSSNRPVTVPPQGLCTGRALRLERASPIWPPLYSKATFSERPI